MCYNACVWLLGFEVQVDHPHPHVVKCMQFLKGRWICTTLMLLYLFFLQRVKILLRWHILWLTTGVLASSLPLSSSSSSPCPPSALALALLHATLCMRSIAELLRAMALRHMYSSLAIWLCWLMACCVLVACI